MLDRENLLDTLIWLSNSITHNVQFEDRPDRMKQVLFTFQRSLRGLIDWENLRLEDCKFLGFGKCFPNTQGIDEMLYNNSTDQEEKKKLQIMRDLWIIPSYLLPIVPGDLELFTSLGERIVLEPGSETAQTSTIKLVCGDVGIIPKES